MVNRLPLPGPLAANRNPAHGRREATLRFTVALLAGLLFLLTASRPALSEVRASLERSTIRDGETTTLLIEAEDGDSGGEPDLSVLEDGFEILGTSSGQQIRIINGRRSGMHHWRIELLPRHTGIIEVPAITVGSASTRPLRLEVKEQAPPGAAGAGQAVFLEALVEPAEGDIYVQQQLNYTLRLYYREPLLNGSFDGPDIDGAVVQRLGEDIEYTTRVDGVEYRVVERRYAVFPQESGELVIPGVAFNGQLRVARSRGRPSSGIESMLDDFMRGMPFGGGRRIRVRSEAHTVSVAPQPQEYRGKTWLPATSLELHDSWTDEPPEFRVGEPVTRNVTLEAVGLDAAQLPALAFDEVAGMRLYPEQPVRESRSDGQWVHGSSRQSLAYVPTRSGRVQIPEIRVAWWDTQAQRQRTAVLPAWEINVLPGVAQAGEPPPAPAAAAVPAESAPAETTAANPGQEDDVPAPHPWRLWPWLTGGLLALLGLFWLIRRRRRTGRQEEARGQRVVNAESRGAQRRAALERLQRACDADDPGETAQALLALAILLWPEDPPLNLAALAQRLGRGAAEVHALERALYAADGGTWHGDGLWRVFHKGLAAQTAVAPATETGLAPLYPQRDQTRRQGAGDPPRPA